MTDQRARAKELHRKLGDVSGSPTIHELETHDIDLIFTALADERRRVWEEAYEYVKQYHFNVSTSKHATKACVTFEDHFRAQAHAGQEG